MSWEAVAIYEDGVLKPDRPLPLGEHERVKLQIEPYGGSIRQSAGLIPFKGSAEALEYLLSDENHP